MGRTFAACRHCSREGELKGRGLCNSCYCRLEIRNQYGRMLRKVDPLAGCLACLRTSVRIKARGLCMMCYSDHDIRDRYPSLKSISVGIVVEVEDHEPTEDELEQTIAEQLLNPPDWWDVDERHEAERCRRERQEWFIVKLLRRTPHPENV